MKLPIITERLILRRIIQEDVENIFLIDSNPQVMKYLGVPTITNKEESQKMVDYILHQYETNRTGRLAVIEKESNKFIGWSGIKYLTEEINGFKNIFELGYRFLPEYWGKGYATESAIASIDLGFNQLNADKIYAYADVENKSSTHILTKLGFINKGTFMDKGDLCNWFELDKKINTKYKHADTKGN